MAGGLGNRESGASNVFLPSSIARSFGSERRYLTPNPESRIPDLTLRGFHGNA